MLSKRGRRCFEQSACRDLATVSLWTDAQLLARRDALPQSQCWLTWLGYHPFVARSRAKMMRAVHYNSTELPWHYVTCCDCVLCNQLRRAASSSMLRSRPRARCSKCRRAIPSQASEASKHEGMGIWGNQARPIRAGQLDSGAIAEAWPQCRARTGTRPAQGTGQATLSAPQSDGQPQVDRAKTGAGLGSKRRRAAWSPSSSRAKLWYGATSSGAASSPC